MTSPWFEETGPPEEEAQVAHHGAQVPQPGSIEPSGGLPLGTHHYAAGLWIVGAHGGAGETSIAALSDAFAPAHHAWPRAGAALLVCRSTAGGLRAAQQAAIQWASGALSVDLVGLVIVAAAPGRLPKQLRELEALVGGGVPRTWHLDWIEAWRLGEDPSPTATRQVRSLTDQLSAFARPTT
jgi:hypothetical protein